MPPSPQSVSPNESEPTASGVSALAPAQPSAGREEETERRLTALTAALSEARHAVQARDDFLAIAAHELRSPMNALLLQVVALERLARRSQHADLAQRLQRTQAMLQRYVRRATLLLEVSRLNSGRFEIQARHVDLSQIVAQVIESYAEEALFHKVVFRTELPDDVTGRWDADAIEEIVANVVSNAIKYGDGKPVIARTFVDGEWACVQVQDAGPGLTEAQRLRAFQKFERLVDGGHPRSGFGLGLWIVGQLVAAHGGRIDIESTPGAGSTFTARLPRRVHSS